MAKVDYPIDVFRVEGDCATSGGNRGRKIA
jgi:hypothetical protein